MTNYIRTIVIAISLFALTGVASAHFQALIPDHAIIGVDARSKAVAIKAVFTHPMEQGPIMEMGAPQQFGVLAAGEHTDLKDSLTAMKVEGKTTYVTNYAFNRPGDYVFYIEPAPYWEPAEGKMIVHYTKVVVNAMGLEEGWDQSVGFPVEIEPLTRPYGLWTGNVFRAIVRKDGQPVPFAEIEIEHWNANSEIKPPASPFVTQVIKADANGEFAYAMPRAGWWGFAALVDGDKPMNNPDGQSVDVELGALMWVHCVDIESATTKKSESLFDQNIGIRFKKVHE